MKTLCKVFVAAILCISAPFVMAEKTSFYVGEIGLGARSLALGGLAAGSDEISGISNNPASIARIKERYSLLVGQNKDYSWSDWKEEQVGFVLPNIGSFRLGGFYIREAVSLLEENNNIIENNHWGSKIIGIGGGLRLRPNLEFGVSMNHILLKNIVEGELLTGRATLYNLGVILSPANWQIGMVAHNLPLIGDMDVIPDYHFGMAWIKSGNRIQLETVFYQPPEDRQMAVSIGGGIEVSFTPALTMRIGRKQMRLHEQAPITFGLGIKAGAIGIDYTYSIKDVTSSHRFSSSWHF